MRMTLFKFQQELRSSELLGGRACPGVPAPGPRPRPRGQGRPPGCLYPTLTRWGGGIFPPGIFARTEDVTVVGWQSLPGGQPPGLGRPPPPLPYLDWGGGKFSLPGFLQELRISRFLGGGACPGAQPLGLGRAPPRLYPILTVRGGGQNFPFSFFAGY